MPSQSIEQNFAIGAEAESAYQQLNKLALDPGQHTLRVSLEGQLDRERGQLQVQVEGANGLTFENVTVAGARSTPNFQGPVGGTILPFDFDIPPNGTEITEEFVASLEISLTVLTAGDFLVSAAAPNPPSDAASSDVHLIRLAVLTAD